MITKKVCLLGSFAVGKTSLVSRYVKGIFSEKYLTTLGVKIDKKILDTQRGKLNMQLWDLAGDDDYQKLRMSYLKGSSGFMMVVDGTRRSTLEQADSIFTRLDENFSQIPLIMLLNKWDLQEQWELDDTMLRPFLGRNITILYTSAKTGNGVEEAFSALAEAMVEHM